MAIVFVPFDGWAPSPAYFGEGWSTVTNLYPSYASWKPWRACTSPAGSTAIGPMTGSHAHLWMSGAGTASYLPDEVTLFTGSKQRLFTVDPSTGNFTDVSRAANYATAVGAEPAGWRFASVGNDTWATNWYDVPQRRVNNAGLFTNGCTGAFIPQPRFIATVREHLVGANLSNGGRFQDEVAWSDADNASDFNPPTGTSTSIAGSKRLISIPGQITGLVGGQHALAFKRLGIFSLEYTGTSQVFRPDVLSTHVGTAYTSSIINSRYGVFFLGPDGFYQINGFSQPVKISTPGVDQHLMDSAFSFYSGFTATQEDGQMMGFQAAAVPLIGWAYRVSWGEDGNYLFLLYNPVTGKWSTAEHAFQRLFALVQRPFALMVQDTILAGFTWNGIASKFASFAQFASEATIRPPSMSLRFRPANVEAHPERQSIVAGVLPVFSKATLFDVPQTLSVSVESLLDPSQAGPGTETATERNVVAGWYPFAIAGRFFRISVSGAAEDFGNFEGVYLNILEAT